MKLMPLNTDDIQIRKGVFRVYVLFFLLAFFLVTYYDKYSLHLTINKLHTSFFDVFFKYSTFLGDGVMFGVFVVLFFFIKRRMSMVFLVAGISTLIVTHLFKKIIFKGIARPAAALGEDSLHLIEGVKMAFWNSFPSGHTTTAFAVFTILCLYFAKCKSQYLWVSLAFIAGFSRIYLSQHFLIDVFVGSFIGIIIGVVSMKLICKSEKVH